MKKVDKKTSKKKKKMSQGGFTLIELLAVVTIMGILMLVAIPAVSRIIENTRRDSYATIAKNYLQAVRNGFIADTIECGITTGSGDSATTTYYVASALPDGTYYFPIATGTVTGDATYFTNAVSSTKDLMESGGKSSFGSAELYGYVQIKKDTEEDTKPDGTVVTKPKVEYKLALVDTGNHGFTTPYQENDIKRSNVKVSGETKATVSTALSGKIYCKVS